MRTHETDAVSLTAGLILLGIANCWLMVAAGAADVAGLRYLFPATLLVAGTMGLVASLRRTRGPARASAPAPPVDDTTSDGTTAGTELGPRPPA